MESRVIAPVVFFCFNSRLAGSIVKSRVIAPVAGPVCFHSKVAGSILK